VDAEAQKKMYTPLLMKKAREMHSKTAIQNMFMKLSLKWEDVYSNTNFMEQSPSVSLPRQSRISP